MKIALVFGRRASVMMYDVVHGFAVWPALEVVKSSRGAGYGVFLHWFFWQAGVAWYR